MTLNVKADIRIRVELWQDICKKCATIEEKEGLKNLKDRVEKHMRDTALKVLKGQGIEVTFQ